jgi:murein DD-endopeptidase MepM/ murein hydrolase activator NlpD
MRWYRGRARTASELSMAGALGGMALLSVSIAMSARREALAATGMAASANAKADSRVKPADLLFPGPAVSQAAMANSFADRRGARTHHAVDILAPRHAEVVAVADGSIARLMTSAAGGIAVYQWSGDQRVVYYYAHLQGYAPDLAEGRPVARGQVLGYVGTTGNAPPNTPHLHFAITRVEKGGLWGGAPVDPYPIWR